MELDTSLKALWLACFIRTASDVVYLERLLEHWGPEMSAERLTYVVRACEARGADAEDEGCYDWAGRLWTISNEAARELGRRHAGV